MIVPTILEKNIKIIQKLVTLLDPYTKRIQIDIADEDLVEGGNYLGAEVLKNLSANCELELDLRDKNPIEYIDTVKEVFIRVIIPVESDFIEEFLNMNGFEKGLSIRLETPLSSLEKYIAKLNFVQFMGVEPGIQGRPFEYKVLEKIKEFKKIYADVETQVDGHLNADTIPLVKNLGVDNFVVGSAIVKTDNPVENYVKLSKLLEK